MSLEVSSAEERSPGEIRYQDADGSTPSTSTIVSTAVESR